jgi:hypothetical protein
MLQTFGELHILVIAMEAEFIETVSYHTDRQISSHGTDLYHAYQHNYFPQKSGNFFANKNNCAPCWYSLCSVLLKILYGREDIPLFGGLTWCCV